MHVCSSFHVSQAPGAAAPAVPRRDAPAPPPGQPARRRRRRARSLRARPTGGVRGQQRFDAAHRTSATCACTNVAGASVGRAGRQPAYRRLGEAGMFAACDPPPRQSARCIPCQATGARRPLPATRVARCEDEKPPWIAPDTVERITRRQTGPLRLFAASECIKIYGLRVDRATFWSFFYSL
jgi:hypothetical protein